MTHQLWKVFTFLEWLKTSLLSFCWYSETCLQTHMTFHFSSWLLALLDSFYVFLTANVCSSLWSKFRKQDNSLLRGLDLEFYLLEGFSLSLVFISTHFQAHLFFSECSLLAPMTEKWDTLLELNDLIREFTLATFLLKWGSHPQCKWTSLTVFLSVFCQMFY